MTATSQHQPKGNLDLCIGGFGSFFTETHGNDVSRLAPAGDQSTSEDPLVVLAYSLQCLRKKHSVQQDLCPVELDQRGFGPEGFRPFR